MLTQTWLYESIHSGLQLIVTILVVLFTWTGRHNDGHVAIWMVSWCTSGSIEELVANQPPLPVQSNVWKIVNKYFSLREKLQTVHGASVIATFKRSKKVLKNVLKPKKMVETRRWLAKHGLLRRKYSTLLKDADDFMQRLLFFYRKLVRYLVIDGVV